MCLLRKVILFIPIQKCYIIIHWMDFVFVSRIGGEITYIKEKTYFLIWP